MHPATKKKKKKNKKQASHAILSCQIIKVYLVGIDCDKYQVKG